MIACIILIILIVPIILFLLVLQFLARIGIFEVVIGEEGSDNNTDNFLNKNKYGNYQGKGNNHLQE